jgi:ABC-type lipoprotein release transport system permease subunit
VIVLIALRNIVRNWKNSLVIFLLIGVITFLFFIGNSVLGSSNRGLRQAYVDSLTGDILIEAQSDISMNLFSANSPSPVLADFIALKPLPAHDAIMEEVLQRPGVDAATSQVSTTAFLDLLGEREAVLLAGVDAESYFSLFPGIALVEGRFLQDGEYGAMITEERAESLEIKTGKRPDIGTPLLFTSGGNVGVKIREVPLVGIYAYTLSNDVQAQIVLADPQTVRVLSAIQVASPDVEVPDAAVSLLENEWEMNDLFSAGTESLFQDYGDDSSEEFSIASLNEFLKTEEAVDASETEAAEAQALIGGDWNFIIVRLKNGVSDTVEIAALNKVLAPYGAMAVGWRSAAGNTVMMALLLQLFFNFGIALVSIAGVIAVINILLIAVFKRTREIGTLRAIGAQDSYIRTLVLSENITLGLTGGIAGVVLGTRVLSDLNSAGLEIQNQLLASLLGQNRFYIELSSGMIGVSLLVAAGFSILASVYPVETAVRIEPIVAIRQG